MVRRFVLIDVMVSHANRLHCARVASVDPFLTVLVADGLEMLSLSKRGER